MKSLITAILLTAFVSAQNPPKNPDLDEQWEDFVQRYDKNYGDEEGHRREIWEQNLAFIEKHNAEASNGEHTFTVGINEYADWTSDEFVRYMNGLNYTEDLQVTIGDGEVEKWAKELPSNVDWVNEGYVTGVKNQKACGSCWAFSATGSLEGQHYKKTGKLVSLSEQNLVDCDKLDHGCLGGLMSHAFTYIKENNGIDTESSYPYTAKTGKKCLFKAEDVGATLQSYKSIPHGDEDALQRAVASVGPISVGIDAGHPSFQLYKKGIYYEPHCSSVRLDHGVLVVGYGQDYWLVKNSWGTSWGMEGYIKMSRNRKNNCGIASQAVYPVV